METVRPAAARQNAARELVHDVHVVVLHHVIHIPLVQAVRAQQLIDHVHALRLLHEVRLYVAFLLDAVLLGKRLVAVDLAHGAGEIGHHKHLRILRVHLVAAEIRQRHLACALVDGEVELPAERDALLLAHFGEHLHFHVLVELADVGVLEHVKHLLVLRHGVVHLVDLALALLRVAVGERLLRLRDEFVALLRLDAHDGFDQRLERVVLGARGDGRGAGDDERRARLVDEDGVHLIDNREVVSVLHHLLRLHGHAVVAEVVEAKLGVRAVGDVAVVLLAPLGGFHGVLDAAHGEAEVLVEMPHPRRVAARQVVVHGDELHVLSGERVQVERQRGDERLAFACLHLGDLPLVQHDAAHELAVERDHVPRERMSAYVRGGAHEMAARVLDERERLGQDVVQRLAARNALLELRRQAREVRVGQVLFLILLLEMVDLCDDRLELLQFPGVLGAENHLDDIHFPLPSSMFKSSATSIPAFSRDSSLILSIVS